mmetsp:Transcript_22197/g.52771  ORF Transcript_22197/g.52771 Transcript_22197/m.52771 type:complete len:206 (+) Transcript_22197:520-1137(+)
MRLLHPLERNSATVSVPNSCFSTLAIYMSQNIMSNSSSCANRIAVSPLAASRMIQSGATILMVRPKSFRRTRSSSTNRTLRTFGSSGRSSSMLKCTLCFGTALVSSLKLTWVVPSAIAPIIGMAMIEVSNGADCRSTTKRAPGLPGIPLSYSLSRLILPPISSTRFLHKCSPIPVPWLRRSRDSWYFAKRLSRFSSGIPDPESST